MKDSHLLLWWPTAAQRSRFRGLTFSLPRPPYLGARGVRSLRVIRQLRAFGEACVIPSEEHLTDAINVDQLLPRLQEALRGSPAPECHPSPMVGLALEMQKFRQV